MPKTPITYYGGKQNMLQHILPLIPKHTIYVEPFFGGGAVFFAKTPAQSEIINDTNAMVINFYKVCKNDFENLKQKVEETIFSRTVYTVAYAMYRVPHLFSELQQAWSFYISTNMAFGSSIGSWALDKYGKRLKAFRNKKIRFDKSIPTRLENTMIENNDACKVISTYDTPETFIYADPPYINSNQGHYGGYSEEDYIGLLDTLSEVKGKFLLSSYPSDILDEYIKKHGWHTKQYGKTLSAVKATKDKPRNRSKVEVLTANYPIE